MNAKKRVVSESEIKKKKAKKRKIKSKKYRPVKFPEERFYIFFGGGIVSAAIGLWLIWETKSPAEDAAQSMGYSTAQRFAHVFPESAVKIIAFILGNLFVLCGVICVYFCLKLVVQHIAAMLRN